MNDKEEFQDMLSGLESLGTSPEEISEIFSTVSAILWIGQIEFRRVEGKKTDVEIVDPSPVQAVAELIRCDYKALTQALMTREYAAGNAQSVAANLSLEQAYYTRDALAKTIYFRLFDFIVGLVNKAMHISNTTDSLNESNLCTMGVLDIYGFEIFENNSFEQLCINFVNEKLQQIFIENTLRAEQEEYRVEKIEWTPVEFFNNKIVCELFESRPKGIFNYLDEACIVPQGSDSSFLQTLDEQLSSHPHYSKPNDRDSKNIAFTVKHYAGDVTYKKHGFIEKNKDLVWFDLLQMGESSQMSIFKTMFPAGDANRMKNSKKRPLTAAAQFKTQVTALMKQLSSSTPHYIRCIKPNDNKQSGVFNDKRVLHQVRYLGLLENVRVRRAGFAFRQDFEGFVGRYKLICESSWPTYSIDSIAGCELICAEMNLKSGSDYQIGISKIFIRKPASLYMLEELREKSIDEIVKRVGENKIMFADSIQKINRKNICQLRYLVVTDKSLFFMKKDKVGSYQQQRQIKIEKVTGISMSPFKDHWVVIHVQEEYDYVIMSERKKELLACLSEVMDIAGYSLNVNHGKSLVYKLKNKTDRFIEFTEDHSISGFSWEVSKKDKNKIDVTVGNMVFNTQDATSPRGHGNVGERAYAY